eukprot:GHVO01027575.1.p1 GENE.GHVO01027575.1~~GHVO01027575.1.p1  ORF type:complete len:406 (+),score=53.69 GHVO01027575.1:56-1273(+)
MQEVNFIGRSRSERLLDRIYNHQSQQLRKIGVKPAYRKKRRSTVDKRKEEPKKPQSRESVTLLAALDRISPHLSNGQKFGKAMDLALELAKSSLDEESSDKFLEIALKICSSEFCCAAASRNSVAGFMKLLLLRSHRRDFQRIDQTGDSDVPLLYDANKSRLIECLAIRGYVQNLLHTDDTYELSGLCEILITVFERIVNECENAKHGLNEDAEESNTKRRKTDNAVEIGSEESASQDPAAESASQDAAAESASQDAAAESASQDPSDSEEEESHVSPEEADGEELEVSEPSGVPMPSREKLAAMKVKNLIAALGGLFASRTKPWARSSVERVFSTIYRQRNVFEPEEEQQIDMWQAALKCKKGASKLGDVLRIGEAANPVIDAREEKISTVHGSSIWSAKQTGI